VRDVAGKLKEKKPALIHSTFLPSLAGCKEKMSSTKVAVEKSGTSKNTIFLTDGFKQIKKKINKAFSGGQDLVEKHRELGGNPDVDVAFHYLRFFLEDDNKLKEIEEKYRSGEMLTGELKKICFETIKPIVEIHKKRRSEITYKLIEKFMTRTIMKT
jgi:tryptophanyl-tRNA synthetase